MKYLSLFSGIGGFEKGIEQSYTQKLLQRYKNCDIICPCKKHVQNAKELSHLMTSIIQQQIQSGVSGVPDKIRGIDISKIHKDLRRRVNDVAKKTEKNLIEKVENTQRKDDRKCLICMVENVLVAESQKKNFLLSNTKTKMDIKIEKNTEQGTCINSLLKKEILTNTIFFVTTVIMQKAGMENVPTCVGFSEIDKYATSIYKRHFPTHVNFGDITTINPNDLPDFDFLVGGFPCQDFSIAGKRAGFDSTRGTLFFEIARIIKKKQPRLFLLENVKGLLSHDKGRTFFTIISALDELGYDCQWQVLNSKSWIPQNRERIFIAGHLRGGRRPEVFPFGDSNQEHIREADLEGCASTLTSRSAGGTNRRGNYIIHNVYGGFGEGIREFRDFSPTIRTSAGGGHIPNVVVGKKIRRLTPRECERLQGFPDDWTSIGLEKCKTPTSCPPPMRAMCMGHETPISDTQRYNVLGNAVTVDVIQKITEKLL